MNAHDVTEVIWHFAGYFRLDPDFARDRLHYDDARSARLVGEDAPSTPDGPPRPEPDDLDSAPVRLPTIPAVAATAREVVLPVLQDVPRLGASTYEPEDIDAHRPVRPIVGAPESVLEAAPTPTSELVTTPDGPDPEPGQLLLDVLQVNTLDDRDHFQSDPQWSGEVPTPLDTHPLDELVATAQAVVPADIATLSGGSDAAIAFAQTIGADGSAPAAMETTIAPGLYWNGVRVDDPASVPTSFGPTIPAMPQPTNGPTGDLAVTTQAAELGANSAFNGALIADANGAAGTLIVLGDRIDWNIIVQANVYADDDVLNTAGAGTVAGGGNAADNLAAIEQTGVDPLPLAAADAQYRVDVVYGDFYDIRVVQQYNILIDDDVVALTSVDHYSFVQTGANELTNITQYDDVGLASYYDVVVVGGRYYDINAIVQLNMLNDNDAVAVSGPDGTDETDGSVASGGNSLLNAATISEYGAEYSQELSPELWAFVQTLGYIPEGDLAALGFSDGGDGYIDVLYVTGDWYDINVVWQENAVSDADAAVLDAGAAGAADGTTQVASTGANALANEAIIVDVDALEGAYVGGDTYEGTTLIQANLVESDDDQIVVGDTATLVPEVIAFIEADTTSGSTADATPATVSSDHLMGTIMS